MQCPTFFLLGTAASGRWSLVLPPRWCCSGEQPHPQTPAGQCQSYGCQSSLSSWRQRSLWCPWEHIWGICCDEGGLHVCWLGDRSSLLGCLLWSTSCRHWLPDRSYLWVFVWGGVRTELIGLVCFYHGMVIFTMISLQSNKVSAITITQLLGTAITLLRHFIISMDISDITIIIWW